jgi:hypothetical protein
MGDRAISTNKKQDSIMGMFDTIVLKYSLSNQPHLNQRLAEMILQTKDLECLGDRYELRSDGSLWRLTEDAAVERWLKTRYSGHVSMLARDALRLDHPAKTSADVCSTSTRDVHLISLDQPANPRDSDARFGGFLFA